MKTKEIIRQNIRNEISRITLANVYGDKKATLLWIISRFEENQVPISLDGLIELSANYSSFLPPSPYSHNTRNIYEAMGLEDVMTYSQFILELPRIWYTTQYRLIVEWKDEFYKDQDTAY